MKDGRACWSIKGGNNLAVLLCAYHTDKQFHAVPTLIKAEQTAEPIELKPLSASKIKETVGKGYEMPHNVHFPPGFRLVREFSRFF